MELVTVSEIAWANVALLKEGVKYGVKNLFSMMLANTAALMYGFSVKPESVVLLRSGKFHTPEKSRNRYLSTGRRIGSWFRYDLSDPNSIAFQQIKAVRKLHTFYSKSNIPFPSLEEMGYTPDKKILVDAVKKDLAFFDIPEAPMHLLGWEPPLQFSQFDVALTQFAFIGLVYLFPESLGISDSKFLDGFFHFWAVVGRMLGLEDRFNLALHRDKELFMKIHNNVGLASLKTIDERVVCLQYALMKGLSNQVLIPLTLKGWMFLGFQDIPGYEGTEFWKLMDWRDKLCYYFLTCTVIVVRKNIIIKFIVNLFSLLTVEILAKIHLPKSSGCPMM